MDKRVRCAAMQVRPCRLARLTDSFIQKYLHLSTYVVLKEKREINLLKLARFLRLTYSSSWGRQLMSRLSLHFPT